MGTKREWDGNGTVTRTGQDEKRMGQQMNGTVDCDVSGRYRDGERDRDMKRMGIGTGSWTDMHMMNCWIIMLQGFIEPNSVKLSLCQSLECLC